MTEKSYGPHVDIMQDAVLMRLQVIGEHLARLRQIDEERFFEIADASWFQVIGLRNVISHGYEVIDFDTIWDIFADDLPVFASTLDKIDPD